MVLSTNRNQFLVEFVEKATYPDGSKKFIFADPPPIMTLGKKFKIENQGSLIVYDYCIYYIVFNPNAT